MHTGVVPKILTKQESGGYWGTPEGFYAPGKFKGTVWQLRFGFPLMWNTDVLEILGFLTGLGYHDSRVEDALDLVVSKQDQDGRWRLERSFNGRFQVDIEQRGGTSKWITLNALRVLKRFFDQ